MYRGNIRHGGGRGRAGVSTARRVAGQAAVRAAARALIMGNRRRGFNQNTTALAGALRQGPREMKVVDAASGSAQLPNGALACNTTGTVLYLSALEVGATFCNRIGRKVEWKSLRFSFQIGASANAVTSKPDILRLGIVYDRQPNGALPALATILQQTDQVTLNTTNALAGLNMNQRDRFVVIMDKRISLPVATSTAANTWTAVVPSVYPCDESAQEGYYWDEFRKLGNLTSHFSADSAPAVVGDCATGAFFLYCVTQVNAAAAEAYSITNWTCRMKFQDQ